MKLPNGDRAEIDVQGKLIGYCLNPLHPTGKHKARVFGSALGIFSSDAKLLAETLRIAARENDATVKTRSAEATKFEIECLVIGPSGSGKVVSGWIVERSSNIPRLTSCYVKLRSKGGSSGSRI